VPLTELRVLFVPCEYRPSLTLPLGRVRELLLCACRAPFAKFSVLPLVLGSFAPFGAACGIGEKDTDTLSRDGTAVRRLPVFGLVGPQPLAVRRLVLLVQIGIPILESAFDTLAEIRVGVTRGKPFEAGGAEAGILPLSRQHRRFELQPACVQPAPESRVDAFPVFGNHRRVQSGMGLPRHPPNVPRIVVALVAVDVVPDPAVRGVVASLAQVVRICQVVGVNPLVPIVHPNTLVSVELVAGRLGGERAVKRHQRIIRRQFVRSPVRTVTKPEPVIRRAADGLAIVERDPDKRSVVLGDPRFDQRRDHHAARLVGGISEVGDPALPVSSKIGE
jgi:hypothetical protein